MRKAISMPDSFPVYLHRISIPSWAKGLGVYATVVTCKTVPIVSNRFDFAIALTNGCSQPNSYAEDEVNKKPCEIQANPGAATQTRIDTLLIVIAILALTAGAWKFMAVTNFIASA